MAWEDYLLPVLVDHHEGKIVTPNRTFTFSLAKPGRKMTRNHLGLAIVGEALRALRVGDHLEGWRAARQRLLEYLNDELDHGLWGQETLATTPHCEFHIAIAMFARRVAVEAMDRRLLVQTSRHCSRLGQLCANLADSTGAIRSAGWRVPLAKAGRGQRSPQHSGLTILWRMLLDLPQVSGWRSGRWFSDPLYVGLVCANWLLHNGDPTLGGAISSQPGAVRLNFDVVISRWGSGHQVVIPRPRPDYTGLTKGSRNPNGVADWLRCEYGLKRPTITFGMLWQTEPPPVPLGAVEYRCGP